MKMALILGINVLAKYADNSSVVSIDQPISLNLSICTADDLNTDFTQAAPFEFTWKKELYGTGGYDNITGTQPILLLSTGRL